MVTDGVSESAAVAAQMRAERAATGMTIDALSSASGIPSQTLMRYLKGTRDIPMRAFIALADALEVPADELLARAQRRYKS